MSALFLTTAEAAELLQVHPSTAKRWLDDHQGVLRTEGGHRRVQLEGLLDLARGRDATTFLEQFHPYESHVWTAIQQAERQSDFDPLISLAMGWLLHSDPGRIGRLFEELSIRERVPFHAVLDRGVQPLMKEIGDGWLEGRVRVGDEHVATQLLFDAFGRLRSRWGLDRPLARDMDSRPVAIVGAVEGNTHHLAALGIRLLLERRGWSVWYLGPNVPADALAQMQRSLRARLVCASFGSSIPAPEVRRCLAELTRMHGPSSPYALAVGGRPVDEHEIGGLDLPFDQFGTFTTANAFVAWLPTVEASLNGESRA